MRIYLIIVLFLLSCTDRNITLSSEKPNTIYSIDNGAFYLRRVVINGDRVYFVVDKDGKPIAGASSSFTAGKAVQMVASIVEDIND